MSELNIFKIREIIYHEFQWSVTWDGYGTIGKTDSNALDKLWRAVWDTNSPQVAFTGINHQVIIIQQMLLAEYQHSPPRFFLDHILPLTGVAFETREQAEQFVHIMEQHVIIQLLKRDYADE